jgi:hypothetical protein
LLASSAAARANVIRRSNSDRINSPFWFLT